MAPKTVPTEAKEVAYAINWVMKHYPENSPQTDRQICLKSLQQQTKKQRDARTSPCKHDDCPFTMLPQRIINALRGIRSIEEKPLYEQRLDGTWVEVPRPEAPKKEKNKQRPDACLVYMLTGECKFGLEECNKTHIRVFPHRIARLPSDGSTPEKEREKLAAQQEQDCANCTVHEPYGRSAPSPSRSSRSSAAGSDVAASDVPTQESDTEFDCDGASEDTFEPPSVLVPEQLHVAATDVWMNICKETTAVPEEVCEFYKFANERLVPTCHTAAGGWGAIAELEDCILELARSMELPWLVPLTEAELCLDSLQNHC
eukprot:TRINITY_DN103316_c0_g1_i1.p1 TRINITY_DN103316_c0_g1~~TRINITY_DN103316_c0_g1_i1.p1  ORF type:complete len:315 (-),score=44.92 TRINITY_DN103316_c0_g1_i1:378-1322(-)